MKLSKTYQVSFCEITPLMTCPEGSRSIRVKRQITPLKIRGVRGVIEITPFNPPYFKGDIEGETPCMLWGDVKRDTRNRCSL